jgi:excisionase family DNA binding protein
MTALLTTRQVAERLNCSYANALTLMKSKRIPTVNIAGAGKVRECLRVQEAALDKWIKEGGKNE